MITRRGLIIGLGGLFCAPAIVRASSIMPVKSLAGFSLDCLDHNGWTVSVAGTPLIPVKDFTVGQRGMVNITKDIAKGAYIQVENVEKTSSIAFQYGSSASATLCRTSGV